MTMAVQSTISDIQKANAAAQEAATTKDTTGTLGKNDFLKLLTAQLQQQDPTQPMDNTEFVAQLAQFSSLEAMNNVNDTLTELLAAKGTSVQTTAASLVGKTAIFETDDVVLEKGKTATITANLSQAATNVNVVIQDDDGTTVRVLTPGAMASGSQRIEWDGLDSNGDAVESGTYTVQITASDINGSAVSLTQSGSARITGITYEDDGTPLFMAGGNSLKLSDISEVDE
jgi:flagellar basal-body rod modification protein FlgD